MNECPECASEKIVKNAALREYAENYAEFNLRVVLFQKPENWIFKQGVYTDIRAEVCGDCGFLQPYAADPAQLWEAYQKLQSELE